MNPDEGDVEMVVQGIVVPVSWDRFGNPLRVAVLTSDEGEYVIAPRGMGRRLFRFLREEVKARLVLHDDDAGGAVARVVSFTVVRRGNGHSDPHEVGGALPPAAGEAAEGPERRRGL